MLFAPTPTVLRLARAVCADGAMVLREFFAASMRRITRFGNTAVRAYAGDKEQEGEPYGRTRVNV